MTMKGQIMRACELPHVPSHRFTDYNAGEESENARLRPLIEKLASVCWAAERVRTGDAGLQVLYDKIDVLKKDLTK